MKRSKLCSKHRKADPTCPICYIWTPFVQREGLPDTEYWENSQYVVLKRVVPQMASEEEVGQLIHLSIRSLDRSARHDWRDLQRIKNELVGEECEAVELYPAESRLVDNANQYHLWCFTKFRFPLFNERLVSEDPVVEGANQRPFVEKPQDLAKPREMIERVQKYLKGNK